MKSNIWNICLSAQMGDILQADLEYKIKKQNKIDGTDNSQERIRA
jgi:hypothetical protein